MLSGPGSEGGGGGGELPKDSSSSVVILLLRPGSDFFSFWRSCGVIDFSPSMMRHETREKHNSIITVTA